MILSLQGDVRLHKINKLETILWSIAIPGFGQLINEKYIRGILFISLEFLINMKAHLNTAIISSFHGEILSAIKQVDYQWLMFYPCIYTFAIWDACRDISNEKNVFFFLPFVMAAYLGTIGVIFSKNLTLMGILFGPIWLPLLFMFLGVLMGLLINKLISYKTKKDTY